MTLAVSCKLLDFQWVSKIKHIRMKQIHMSADYEIVLMLVYTWWKLYE